MQEISNLVYEKFSITCGLLYWGCDNPCLPYSLRITPAANVCFRQEDLCGHAQVSNSSHTRSSLHKWLNCHHCCAGQNSDASPDWGCFDLEAVQVSSYFVWLFPSCEWSTWCYFDWNHVLVFHEGYSTAAVQRLSGIAVCHLVSTPLLPQFAQLRLAKCL